MIDQDFDDLPRWRQIELSLLREIEAGALKVGERLPGENALAPHFGVTRATVRRALSELQHKGVLRVEKGRGAFIERRLQYSLGPRSSFKANLTDASLVPSARILNRFEIKASSEIAGKLALTPGDTICVFDTLGEGSGVILSLTRHHLVGSAFPNVLTRVAAFSCITEVYAEYGFTETKRAFCEITARLPTPEEARHLAQARSEPILEVQSVKSAGKHPIDLTVARFASSRVSVVFDH